MTIARALAGFIIALAIALLARRLRSLSTSGALAATIVGGVAVSAGWRWGALLIVYFVASAALSRFGAESKRHRTAGMLAKNGPRDAMQVVANGGVYACCALLAQFTGAGAAVVLSAAALGALAAATADTWATEIGTLSGGAPRSIVSWEHVSPGTSGGVTVAGMLAMVAGAAFIGLLGGSLGLRGSVPSVLAGGIIGALADSLLGASAQARRWCDACRLHTEQQVHVCGQRSTLASGREWLDNDLVNLCCTMTGAAVAALVVSV